MAIPSKSEIAQQIADFAAKVTPANARWEYAYRAGTYVLTDDFGTRDCFNSKAYPPLVRFLGGPLLMSTLGYRFGQMRDHGSVDAARAAYYARPHHANFRDPYSVGAIEPWQVGHVYFARIVKFPHVIKVGFSHRVRDRIDDIAAKNRTVLDVFATKVGTMADEQWWHRDWRKFNISGEWFFDPRSTERALPDFLEPQRVAA